MMKRLRHRCLWISCWVALMLVSAAQGQVSSQIVVGVTPTCPYGILACSGAAHEGLSRMEEVESVENVPDHYNCTFDVEMKSGGLPRIDRWEEQFKAVVGEGFLFRGVEITVDGSLARDGDQLVLHVPGSSASLRLAPLKHKLQWNFRKRAARQPEPAEGEAYQQLRTQLPRERKAFVQIVGPLQIEETGPIIEVREFYYLQR